MDQVQDRIPSKSDQQFFEKMQLIARDENGSIRATVSEILMVSDTPESYMSNALAVCYRGVERNAAYQLDAKDITGSLDEQIRLACKFVGQNMWVFAVIKHPIVLKRPSFP